MRRTLPGPNHADTPPPKRGSVLRRLLATGRWLLGLNASPQPGRLTPRELHLNPTVATSLTAILGALRWGTVMIGLVFAAGVLREEQENGRGIWIVATVAVAIFLTSWRTMSPLRLGEPSLRAVGAALSDVIILAIAIGLTKGFGNPLVGTLFVAVAVAAFGWGLQVGALAAVLAVGSTALPILVARVDAQEPSALAITALAGSAILPGVVLDRLLEVERRRAMLVAQHDKLTQTNQLLAVLNDLARTMPSSLDQADVVQATRRELIETFDAKRIALLVYEDGTWSPMVQDGFNIPPELPQHELPPVLRRAAQSPDPMLIADLGAEHDRSGCGMYHRLVVDNADTGLLAVEHDDPGHYSEQDRILFSGMADVLALTLANAQSFNRLRSLAAAEERSRIARDLHDRLGQYLTYIALELERINRDVPSSDLKDLQEDVQGAVSEFRDTLLELRAAVTIDRPLTVVLMEVIQRFTKRSEVEVTLSGPEDPNARLPARIENELLRIAQEALTNVEKHAMATKVQITWTVVDGVGTLVVQDDGRGFDPAMGIRGSAYGLVGMRERAASVGALLSISSKPEQGTAITVQSSQTSE